MRRRTRLLLGIATAIASVAGNARAIEPGGHAGGMSDTPLPLPADEVPSDDFVDPKVRRSWREGPVRPFIATTFDVGWVYLRPRLSLGYGRPFSSWIGIDVNPLISGNGLGAYSGVRLSLPRVDFRLGARYFGAFTREYLPPQRRYNRLDLDLTISEPSRVLTYEAEIEASFPLGPGDVIGLGSASYVKNVPEGRYVFEETLRVIVDPPLVWRARGGYVVRFGSMKQHSVGIVADVLNVPKRDDSTTVRAGPVVRIVLSRRVEIRGTFVPTIFSPDALGLVGGDFTELGFRYRWATE